MFEKSECPYCSYRYEYESNQTGKYIPCPACQQSILLFPVKKDQKRQNVIQLASPQLLPQFTDPVLSSIPIQSYKDKTQTYNVNLIDYTCTCSRCMKRWSLPPLDFGRLCSHIVKAIRREKFIDKFPIIAQGIIRHGMGEYWQNPIFDNAFGVYPGGKFAMDFNGNPIYITGKSEYGYIGVYALKRWDGKNYYYFSFDTNSGTWRQFDGRGGYIWRAPKIDVSILGPS